MELKAQERNIIFIAPSTSQPRFHKRVLQLKQIGNVFVFAFKRGYYNENCFPPEISFHSLGVIEDGKYWSRIFSIIKAVNIIIKHFPKKSRNLFYALSIDCLIIGKLCRFERGIYEVGDLIYTKKNLLFFLMIEKIALRGITALVLTSRFFYDGFYQSRNVISKNRVLIIDNKVNRNFSGQRKLQKNVTKDKVVIGIIGLFRFKKPIELLLEYVSQRKDTHILKCYGDGPYRSLIESYESDNINYLGSFKNPEGLSEIYNSIDINFVVYDYSDRNVQLALPNKLFESAFFGVPILCGKRTALGTLSESWGIGKMISIETKEEFEQDLKDVDYTWILMKSNNCFKISEDELVDQGDKQIASLPDLF